MIKRKEFGKSLAVGAGLAAASRKRHRAIRTRKEAEEEFDDARGR
jgi:hypothetical protein